MQIRSSSSRAGDDEYPEPATVYLRETENLKSKSKYAMSVGVQCDLKLAHPHFRAIQSQVNKLKVDLEKKNKIIKRMTDDSTSQVDELTAQLRKITEEKALVQKQTQATYEMYNKEKEDQFELKMSKQGSQLE